MNVWALSKAVDIKHFVYECQHQFGNHALVINDSIAHHQAIVLQALDQPALSAYVYSFSQSEACYGVDLFYPIEQHDIIGENEGLTLDQLLHIVQTHFDLSRVDLKAI